MYAYQYKPLSSYDCRFDFILPSIVLLAKVHRRRAERHNLILSRRELGK